MSEDVINSMDPGKNGQEDTTEGSAAAKVDFTVLTNAARRAGSGTVGEDSGGSAEAFVGTSKGSADE